jgi:putative phosphoribosyl transferase
MMNGYGPPLFHDRADAGRRLASALGSYKERRDVIVLALPRGGVPVGYEIATALRVPLDVYAVRKLGVPGHEELAMGAIASDGSYVIDEATINMAGVTREEFRAELDHEFAELKRRERAYRDDRPEPNLERKAVIVVDDGLATGSSMYAAVEALRHRNPAEIVVAVPVAPAETCRSLQRVADRVVCPHQPHYFGAVGLYYADFAQIGDEEVRRLLSLAPSKPGPWKVA